jgi:hypothetical protein
MSTSSTVTSSTSKASELIADPNHVDRLSGKTEALGFPRASIPSSTDVVHAQTYWSASSTSSLAARRAGAMAASVPATIAMTTKAISVPTGNWNVRPSL